MANEAIKCPYTQIPTTEDIITKFQDSTRFSKIDLKEAYHRFELTPESRNIIAFYGPEGLFRYKRLNHGTKSAQDILKIEMQNILSGIPHQVNISDDILVGGSPADHDEALGKVLHTLHENVRRRRRRRRRRNLFSQNTFTNKSKLSIGLSECNGRHFFSKLTI